MPYLDKNLTKKVRQELRARFPEYKFSVRTKHHSSMAVTIKSGPMELTESGHEQVNHFYVDEHYEDKPKVRDFLSEIVSIMKREQSQEVYDMDYGSVPNYYVSLSIGKWDEPYEVTN